MASLVSVTREQFKIRSELEVVHIPTGAVLSGVSLQQSR